MSTQTPVQTEEPLRIGSHTLNNRLIVGTGRYDDFELMRR